MATFFQFTLGGKAPAWWFHPLFASAAGGRGHHVRRRCGRSLLRPHCRGNPRGDDFCNSCRSTCRWCRIGSMVHVRRKDHVPAFRNHAPAVLHPAEVVAEVAFVTRGYWHPRVQRSGAAGTGLLVPNGPIQVGRGPRPAPATSGLKSGWPTHPGRVGGPTVASDVD